MSRLTQRALREALDYDPATGVFRRRTKAGGVEVGTIVGTREGGGYLLIRVNGERHKAHRLAFLWMEGAFPPEAVDHINLKTDDNRWCNLRCATWSENKANTRAFAGKALPKGVFQHGKRYRAIISKGGNRFNLGTYDTADEAHRAYAEKARVLFGSFARAA